jgi:hypothetical protein
MKERQERSTKMKERQEKIKERRERPEETKERKERKERKKRTHTTRNKYKTKNKKHKKQLRKRPQRQRPQDTTIDIQNAMYSQIAVTFQNLVVIRKFKGWQKSVPVRSSVYMVSLSYCLW